ncbi:uncharacterized protein B0H18DRAFT_326555 [Fomitopsis serialis]|uniref:uncharacterized protein n=1 Tax=Fomitopsis serialis TaxID=139415 RepID=UPI002007C67E|nr:uncharacterized protein B0H18DRAFT_326555 [Neoantrodia serialis]KAH9936564.1 hypothetical protein B0H18DRAFT_326555 [Neoantrodia serialis]
MDCPYQACVRAEAIVTVTELAGACPCAHSQGTQGRVGAQLPAEPWNASEGEPSSASPSPEGRRRQRHLRRPTALCTIRDSRMIMDGQPWFVRDGSPVHGSVVLVREAAHDSETLVPPLLRSHAAPFPRHLDSPPSSIPSLCPSSPTSSSRPPITPSSLTPRTRTCSRRTRGTRATSTASSSRRSTTTTATRSRSCRGRLRPRRTSSTTCRRHPPGRPTISSPVLLRTQSGRSASRPTRGLCPTSPRSPFPSLDHIRVLHRDEHEQQWPLALFVAFHFHRLRGRTAAEC